MPITPALGRLRQEGHKSLRPARTTKQVLVQHVSEQNTVTESENYSTRWGNPVLKKAYQIIK